MVSPKSRKRLVALSILVCLGFAASYLPPFRTYSHQDNCAFGPISNSEYRRDLAKAKELHHTKWLDSEIRSEEITNQLNSRLLAMNDSESSLFKRIAIIHAIARASGAQFLNANAASSVDPYSSQKRGYEVVELNYEVDISRFALLQIYPRQVWIKASILDPAGLRPEARGKHPDLKFTAHTLWFLDPPGGKVLDSFGADCPPVPSAELAARYDALRK